jgi:hypothetical protein
MHNQSLPESVRKFQEEDLKLPSQQLTEDQFYKALRATEVKDKKQQIRLRPLFAWGVFILIFVQTGAIFWLSYEALRADQLPELQLIFAALVAGTLTQSYLILKFITNKIFSDIKYHNSEPKLQ